MRRVLWLLLVLDLAFGAGFAFHAWLHRPIEAGGFIVPMPTTVSDSGAIGGDVCGQPWTICWKTA